MSRTAPWSAVAMFVAGCFSGADAEGLPCAQSAQCGRGQSCIDGVCGGRPALVTTATTGSRGTGTSTGVSASSSESTAVAPGCGNGVLEDNEACDDRGESAACDADCTVAECGDATVNAAAGEACDEPGGDPFYAPCNALCQRPLFWDDMASDDASEALWEVALPAVDGIDALPQIHRWGVGGGEWRTGLYSCASGVADLSFAEPIALLSPPGMRPELRFRHRHNFDPNPNEGPGNDVADYCPVDANPRDGGAVYVVGDAAADLVAGLGDPIVPSASCPEGGNPLGGVQGFVRQTGGNGFVEEIVSLEQWEGESVRIRFRVGYDCGNCGYECAPPQDPPPDDYGWLIGDVAVAYVPIAR